MSTIGFIGLGTVGKRFTADLMKAGYRLIVHDIDPDKVRERVDAGAEAAESIAQLVRDADIIILALPGSDQVETVMDGIDGIANALRPGQLVIDVGTSRPETDIRYERLAREKGARFLDAPLTFRPPGPILMVGGTADAFEQGRAVLECISYKLQHVGPIGSGQTLKMINQLVLAGQLAVYAEAVETAKMHDVDPRLLQDFLEFNIPDNLYGDAFGKQGQLALHYKDLGYLLEMAHASGAHLPIGSLVHEIFKATVPYGDRDWHQPGIVTYWRRLNGQQKE